MSGVSQKLRDYLDRRGVAYEQIHHRRDFTAGDAAADTETPLSDFAKTVFVVIDDGFAMAVLPATDFVSPERLREALGAGEVALANEDEMQELCPDCEVGAAPPFGPLYDLKVYASPALRKSGKLTFNAGRHDEVLRVSWSDFERLAEPVVMALGMRD